MMKRILYISSIIILSFNLYGQNDTKIDLKKNFETQMLKYFQSHNWDKRAITRDSLYKNSFFRINFNVTISNAPIFFDTVHIIIRNPFFSEKYENAEEEKDYIKNFPKSYSVIYQNSLISLFESGKFACFNLDNFERDFNLENKLNTKKFNYHWIINNHLGGLSGNKIYLWNGENWIKSKDTFPLKDHPKLFEDNEFVVYGDCHGEWGGTVYFYEKATGKTFFTESTCSNTITKSKEGYQVLANLGHMEGSCDIKVIADPRRLSLTQPNEINKTIKGEALGYTDKSNAFKKKFDLYGVQIFSTFFYENRELYIVNLEDLTFIAEIKDNNIEIVHPLFFNDLYTHNPITTSNGDYTLINLDHYGTGLEREISVIIINNNRIAKIDWNENHSR
jgi:hypothetical protein